MGRGLAKTVADMWPEIQWNLGQKLLWYGNVPIVLTEEREGAIFTEIASAIGPHPVRQGQMDPLLGTMVYSQDEDYSKDPEQLPIVAQNSRELPYHVVSFPTKPIQAKVNSNKSNVVPYKRKAFKPDMTIPGFWAVSSPTLIKKSATRLIGLADFYGWNYVCLPTVGCGHGDMKWEDVYQLLSPLLDDRFSIIVQN